MRNLLCLFAFSALAAQAQVLLVDEPKVGSRFEVHDERETTVKILLKARARGSGEARRIASETRYVEEVVGVGPLKLKRTYERSLRYDHPVSKPSEPARSSQHERTVLLEGLNRKLEDGGHLDKEDREELRFERLCAALLPPQRVVESGDQWEISGQAINRALFGDAPAEASDASGAVVKLRSIKRRKEGEVAVLQVKALRVRQKKTLGKPEITLELKGGFEWDVVRGAVLEAELEGQVLYIAHAPGDALSAEAQGPYRWRYQAERVEQEAPSEE
ncbi:MAG: hypothetical protein R3F62_12415 [Planctomycetota bacterium]